MVLIYFFRAKCLCLIALICCSFSCVSDASHGFQFDYTINAFDVENDQMKITIKLSNFTKLNLTKKNWSLHWNQILGTPIKESLPKGIDFKWVNGNSYFILNFGEDWGLASGKSISFNLKTKGVMNRLDYGPKGSFIVSDERTIPATTNIHWKNAKGIESLNLPTAQSRFEKLKNNTILLREEIDWIIPSPKSVVRSAGFSQRFENWKIFCEGDSILPKSHIEQMVKERFPYVTIEWSNDIDKSNVILENQSLPKDAYQLHINKKGILIYHDSYGGLLYALQSLYQIDQISKLENSNWPNLKIIDEPRFGYRGFMLDISRHFFGLEQIKSIIDIMALFKLNQFDLKLTDDEGWRLEIPGLPELTDVGAYRGYTKDERDRLIPMYGSGAQGLNGGNGFLTKEDFVELIEYSASKNINIIPNISFSSHARAAIVAMEARRDRLTSVGKINEANAYALKDSQDNSQYTSAQLYSDNTINICLESTLAFYEKVIDEVALMYDSAQVSLQQINIGADELPYGVWSGSAVCDTLIYEGQRGASLKEIYDQTLMFLKYKIESYNATMGGWEDFLLIHSSNSQSETHIKDEKFDYTVVPYSWNNIWGGGREDMVYKFANAGFKTVMSNSSAFYFDMANDNDMDSGGLNWSGYVDYLDMWAIDPQDIFANNFLNKKHNISPKYVSKTTKLQADKLQNLIGVQSQLWTETVTSIQKLDEMLFPNLIIFAEKAWAQRPSWLSITDNHQEELMREDWNKFINLLGQRTLPIIDSNFPEIQYDLPKPGAIILSDTLHVRTEFPGLKVRYTSDGTLPTPQSEVYKKPIFVKPEAIIYLRTFDTNSRGGKVIKLISN